MTLGQSRCWTVSKVKVVQRQQHKSWSSWICPQRINTKDSPSALHRFAETVDMNRSTATNRKQECGEPKEVDHSCECDTMLPGVKPVVCLFFPIMVEWSTSVGHFSFLSSWMLKWSYLLPVLLNQYTKYVHQYTKTTLQYT